MTTFTLRPGSTADSFTVFNIFEESLADLELRLGDSEPTSWSDPEELAAMWQIRRSLYQHLAESADQFWLAEQDGQPIGFARSVVRSNLRELTELFIKPGVQSAGAGRALMARAFPQDEVGYKSILASPDIRAQALYFRAGVYPRFPVYYLGGRPKAVSFETDLIFEMVANSKETLGILDTIDGTVLGHCRTVDHVWLLSNRQGYVYRRQGRSVGYGYLGRNNGPFALLQDTDFGAVLAYAENEAAVRHQAHFGLEIPAINQAAMDHMVGRNFRPLGFLTVMMTNQPFGCFENYIFTSPPFIM